MISLLYIYYLLLSHFLSIISLPIEIYKELAYVIMKVEKPQTLQLASWRPKRTNGVILI